MSRQMLVQRKSFQDSHLIARVSQVLASTTIFFLIR